LDLSNPAHLWEQEPVPKFLALTVLLGIMDNGHEVSFERVGDSYKVSIAIDHEVHEVVPPPVHIHFGVAQTAKALAGLDLADCTETQEGHIDVKTRDRTVRAKVSVEPVQCGQKVVFRW
jgi:type II secretory ATPase GspE/PulE/Tfp pilus assembly ATPase PilB-like protein